mgnify:CR=1 FL=1|jgi:hypothetical protein
MARTSANRAESIRAGARGGLDAEVLAAVLGYRQTECKQNERDAAAESQSESRRYREAMEKLQAMVMSALMSEMENEPEEEPGTSRSGASRRSAYAEYSLPSCSSVR